MTQVSATEAEAMIDIHTGHLFSKYVIRSEDVVLLLSMSTPQWIINKEINLLMDDSIQFSLFLIAQNHE